MRTLAIGDIHGCLTALTRLLCEVDPEPEDRLVFLGDYIDRGPNSRGVVDHLLGLARTCNTVFLRGNHEVMILDARDESLKSNLWQNYGGLEAVASYGCTLGQDWVSAVAAPHWSFFEQTRAFLRRINVSLSMHASTLGWTWPTSRTGCSFGRCSITSNRISQASASFAATPGRVQD